MPRCTSPRAIQRALSRRRRQRQSALLAVVALGALAVAAFVPSVLAGAATDPPAADAPGATTLPSDSAPPTTVASLPSTPTTDTPITAPVQPPTADSEPLAAAAESTPAAGVLPTAIIGKDESLTLISSPCAVSGGGCGTPFPNPFGFGQEIRFTVFVFDHSEACLVLGDCDVPTGTVDFTIQGDGIRHLPLARADDNEATATFTTTSIPPGHHPYTGHYTGSDQFDESQDNGSIDVAQAPTSFSLTQSSDRSTEGDPVTFTIEFTGNRPNGQSPLGQIQLFDGANPLGSPTFLDGFGNDAVLVSSLPAGSHTIHAHYGGDDTFAASDSNNVQHDVTPVPVLATTTHLDSSPNPATLKQTITLTATVAAAEASAGTPTGDVAFFVEGSSAPIGTATLNAGKATFGIAAGALGPGHQGLSATYQGAKGWDISGSGDIDQDIESAATTTTLTSDHNPSHLHQPVEFTATVDNWNHRGLAGMVTFRVDGNVASVDELIGSRTAPFDISDLGAGHHTVTATYEGSDTYDSSVGTIDQRVLDDTTTTIVPSANPGTAGTPITFDVTVTPAHDGPKPEGTVTFTDGDTKIGTAVVDPGHASFTTSSLDAGMHAIVAHYGGDANNAASDSAALSESVIAVAGQSASRAGGSSDPSDPSSLPFTGADIAWAAGAGLLLTALGALVVILTGRRGRKPTLS